MKILLMLVLLALFCKPSLASDVDGAGSGMDLQADDCVLIEPYDAPSVDVADIRVLNYNSSNFRTRKFLRSPDCEALHKDVVQNEPDVATIRWHVLGWACGVVEIPADVGAVSGLERIRCQ